MGETITDYDILDEDLTQTVLRTCQSPRTQDEIAHLVRLHEDVAVVTIYKRVAELVHRDLIQPTDDLQITALGQAVLNDTVEQEEVVKGIHNEIMGWHEGEVTVDGY